MGKTNPAVFKKKKEKKTAPNNDEYMYKVCTSCQLTCDFHIINIFQRRLYFFKFSLAILKENQIYIISPDYYWVSKLKAANIYRINLYLISNSTLTVHMLIPMN